MVIFNPWWLQATNSLCLVVNVLSTPMRCMNVNLIKVRFENKNKFSHVSNRTFSLDNNFSKRKYSFTTIWTQVILIKGSLVSSVYASTTESMLIFGGYDHHGNTCNDLFEYSIPTQMWKKLDTQNRPPSRYGHCAVLLGNDMLIFGGQSEDGSALDDLWSLRYIATYKKIV